MSVLVSVALFYTMTNILLWDPPGDVLAAPASALCGWKGVNSLSILSLYNTLLSLSLQQLFRAHVSCSSSYGSMTCSSHYNLPVNAWTPLRVHNDHFIRIVKCRPCQAAA